MQNPTDVSLRDSTEFRIVKTTIDHLRHVKNDVAYDTFFGAAVLLHARPDVHEGDYRQLRADIIERMAKKLEELLAELQQEAPCSTK